MRDVLITTRKGATSGDSQTPENQRERAQTSSNSQPRTIENLNTNPKQPYKVGPPRKNQDSELASAELPKLPAKKVQFRELPYVEVPPLNEARQKTSTPNREPTIRSDVEKSKSDHITFKSGPVYKSRAPVEDELDLDAVVDGIMDLNVTIPLRSLAGVSNVVRDGLRKQVTRNRKVVGVEENKKVFHFEEDNDHPSMRCIDIEDLPAVECLLVSIEDVPGVEGPCWVANDPVVQYLESLKGEKPEEILVARESEDLRAIYARVNNVRQEECLLDPGSQLVSMSKEMAVKTGLSWDPAVRINMESANKQIVRSLGLARNVRFSFGGVNIFLQVHILQDPAYRILLGRPFDTFTRSVVTNESDGNTTLLITDPNSKKQAVLPTYKRGENPDTIAKQDLQSQSF